MDGKVYGVSQRKHTSRQQLDMAQTQTQTPPTLAFSAYWTAQADAVSIWAQEPEPEPEPEQREKAANWDDFKYGLCELCSKGLEDKSDFLVKVDAYGRYLACYDCGST